MPPEGYYRDTFATPLQAEDTSVATAAWPRPVRPKRPVLAGSLLAGS